MGEFLTAHHLSELLLYPIPGQIKAIITSKFLESGIQNGPTVNLFLTLALKKAGNMTAGAAGASGIKPNL